MEKITNLDELSKFLKENIAMDFLFAIENESISLQENFANAFESGYANAYANLLCVLDSEFRKEYDELNSSHGDQCA